EYIRDLENWTDPALRPHVLKRIDAGGLARDGVWVTGQPGIGEAEQAVLGRPAPKGPDGIEAVLGRSMAGHVLEEENIVRLFEARDGEAGAVMEAADSLRADMVGPDVTHVVNRNINYTNVCTYNCRFCAFSKGRGSNSLRGRPYDLTLEEIVRRSVEARERGATEVCLQGGIHPDYTGKTYLAILKAIKQAVPELHVHAFSPLEIFTGAASLGVPLRDFLGTLRDAGLGSLPGTAAEILDDRVRKVICPDKLKSAEWIAVMEAAHEVGLKTTATIMFGHVDTYRDWARHLLTVRALQEKTGGFTEFVPLPFVAREAPFYKSGQARQGPTLREALLMHAVARLVLHPLIPNIQVSWPKMGPEAAALALRAGVNDLGGTLMNESISRAAGSEFGQELPAAEMARIAASVGRTLRQRTTLYGEVAEGDHIGNRYLPPLRPSINIPAGKYSNIAVT
ncbi:MAG: 5-amino-6-(D-ribitylamino)uracil--L-tyrosine 4-hydroxyphenyl transferase CofH, partial [Sphingomonadales bacterium]